MRRRQPTTKTAGLSTLAPWLLGAAIGLFAYAAYLVFMAVPPSPKAPLADSTSAAPASTSTVAPPPATPARADHPPPDLGIVPSASNPYQPEPSPAENQDLPPLPQSDPWLRQQADAFNLAALRPWFDGERLAERAALLLDNLATGHLPPCHHFAPPRLAAPFPVKPTTAPDRFLLDPAGYGRYQPWLDALTAIDSQKAVAFYRRAKPLLQAAYGQLGNPNPREDLDAVLLMAIDRVLATQTPDGGPQELTRPSVFYRFADPAVEARSNLDKQLIRMGPGNAEALKAKLRALRAALIAQP